MFKAVFFLLLVLCINSISAEHPSPALENSNQFDQLPSDARVVQKFAEGSEVESIAFLSGRQVTTRTCSTPFGRSTSRRMKCRPGRLRFHVRVYFNWRCVKLHFGVYLRCIPRRRAIRLAKRSVMCFKRRIMVECRAPSQSCAMSVLRACTISRTRIEPKTPEPVAEVTEEPSVSPVVDVSDP